jgi:hypothetical protein
MNKKPERMNDPLEPKQLTRLYEYHASRVRRLVVETWIQTIVFLVSMAIFLLIFDNRINRLQEAVDRQGQNIATFQRGVDRLQDAFDKQASELNRQRNTLDSLHEAFDRHNQAPSNVALLGDMRHWFGWH